MSVVSVVAISDFKHGGRQFRTGEAVDVEAVEAAALARLGVVTLSPNARPAYQTRDMVAADPAPTLSVPIAESLAAKDPPKRRYRRKKVEEPEESDE